jgi:hypothetical protein
MAQGRVNEQELERNVTHSRSCGSCWRRQLRHGDGRAETAGSVSHSGVLKGTVTAVPCVRIKMKTTASNVLPFYKAKKIISETTPRY